MTARPGVVSATVLACIALSGCGAVDARPDFLSTSELIRARTGSDKVYKPETDLHTVELVVASLTRNGLQPDEAVTVALLQNPQLQARFQDIGISRAALVQAGLPMDPTVSLALQFPRNIGVTGLSVSLTQALLDLLLIPSRERARSAELEAARLEAARFAVGLAQRVRQSCYEVLTLRQTAARSDEAHAVASRGLAVARQRLASGDGDVVDVQLAQAAVLAAESGVVRARRDVAVRTAVVGELLGLGRGDTEFEIVGDLPRVGRVQDTASLEALARRERLIVRIENLRVAAAEARTDTESLGRLPKTKLGVAGQRAPTPPSVLGPTLQIQPPVWGANAPAIARAAFELERARHTRDAAVETVIREVRQAVSAVNYNAKLVELFELRAIPLARKSVVAAENSYRAGQRQITAWIAAQRSSVEQRAAYGRALLEYAQSLTALEAAVGGRLPGAR